MVLWEPTPQYSHDPRAIFASRVASWIETYCWIRPKNGAPHRIRFNQTQHILMQFVAWRWTLGLPAKAITPKARQLGSSTFWDCLLYALAENLPAFQAAIIAHDEDGVSQLWGKVSTIKNHLDRSPRGPSDLLNKQEGHYKWRSDSALFSGQISSGDSLGKGGTPSAIHFSEVANFSDAGNKPEEAISSILGAMAESPWAVEAYESTAKGKDKVFYARCQEAKDPNSSSDLTLIFLPWFLEPGYSMDWMEYRQRLVSSGKQDPGPEFVPSEEEVRLRYTLSNLQVTPQERSYRHRTDLSDPQLIWRRWALANKCKGNLDVFKRYFPCTYEECFTASVDAAFSVDTIEHYRNQAAAPLTAGNIVWKNKQRKVAHVVPDSTGPISIWEYPIPHAPYVIGGDPGGLKATADPTHAYVMHKLTRKVVAMIHGNMEDTDTTDFLERLGYFYNRAKLVVENNQNPAVANELHRRSYPNLYYYFPEAVIEAHVQGTPGWNTNKKTRKEMIARVRQFYRERLVHNPDEGLPSEMETFIWIPFQTARDPDLDGSYYAQSGAHDDRIMSSAMCVMHLDDDIPPEALTPPEVNPPPNDVEEQVMQFYRDHLEKRAKPSRITHL